jgi:hypothetical protein
MAHLALYLLGSPRIELDGEEIHIGRRCCGRSMIGLATGRWIGGEQQTRWRRGCAS